jgi:predicted  nucleic acid-binding Zn-ribbon protein
MKASLIQRNIKLLEQVLTGLHEEYSNLRKERKKFNTAGDVEKAKLNNTATLEEFENFSANVEMFYGQAAIFTPYIRKFKKKIAGLEEIQRCLKDELRGMQSLEAWIIEDDAFWLQQAQVAQQEGYAVTYSYEEAARVFGETE